MKVYEIDRTIDERWEDLLQNHPQASIFHTRGWLEALRKTYGYAPVAFTTSPLGYRLTNGVPFCEISSWLSGRRLVSLPFSDHCTPPWLKAQSNWPVYFPTCERTLLVKNGVTSRFDQQIRWSQATPLLRKARVSSSTDWTCGPALMRFSEISIGIAYERKFSVRHARVWFT